MACKNCHNLNGEGGFGPDLAGRGLNAARNRACATAMPQYGADRK
jgi:mono/diheme cytochrome c family protein